MPTGPAYYFHGTTKQTTWDLPEGVLPKEPEPEVVAVPAVIKLEPESEPEPRALTNIFRKVK